MTQQIDAPITDAGMVDVRIKHLCGLIAAEQDSRKFLDLVTELNTLLEAKEKQNKVSSPRPLPAELPAART